MSSRRFVRTGRVAAPGALLLLILMITGCGPGLTEQPPVEAPDAGSSPDIADISDAGDLPETGELADASGVGAGDGADSDAFEAEDGADTLPPATFCLVQDECAANERCGTGLGYGHLVCNAVAGLPIGAACEVSSECIGGRCVDGFCARPCRDSRACEGGQVCSLGGPGSGSCVQPSGLCQVCAPEGPWACLDNQCVDTACTSSAECPAGDCVFQGAGKPPSRCGAGSLCLPDAIRVPEMGGKTAFCLKRTACETEADCPGQKCIALGKLLGSSSPVKQCGSGPFPIP